MPCLCNGNVPYNAGGMRSIHSLLVFNVLSDNAGGMDNCSLCPSNKMVYINICLLSMPSVYDNNASLLYIQWSLS